MQCNSCSKKLKKILYVNTSLYTCENNKCHYYGVVVCDPYDAVNKEIKRIFDQDKKPR